MASEVVRLYGRDAALGLVREFLIRDERHGVLRSRRYPVLVFTGTRGMGKTALLADLATRLDQQVPYARIDCEEFVGGARELLSLLAFELNRRCGRYGTLAFPRLITGRIAMAAQLDVTSLDVTNRERARDQVQRVLEEHQRTGGLLKDAVGDILQGGLDALGSAHGVPVVGTTAMDLAGKLGPDFVLGRLVTSRRGRRLILGEGQDWYGHQDRGLGRDPLDVLVDLNRMAAHEDAEGNRREVAELLWAAFLADLRASFLPSRRTINWTLNCVVLLDNADTEVGHDFLNELVEARKQRAAHAAGEHDPLTVVATSRGSLAERVLPRGEAVTDLAAAGYPDYLRRGRTQVGTWWYPVTLRDLTREEVGNMVSALELPGGTRREVTLVVHRFAGGHPGSTRVLLDAIAEHPDGPADLLATLDDPEPVVRAGGRRTAEEGLLRRFLEGVPDDAAADLVTCAAARHKEAALRLAAESGLLTQTRGEQSVIFGAELWRAHAPDRPATLHPVLRRLLLRRLGAREPDALASWTATYGWLRKSSQDASDEPGELYHALALGEVEHVARWFARSLEEAGTGEWLGMLRSVTVAPNRLDHRQPPDQQIGALTGWAERRDLPLAPLGRLIAAKWIYADPLSAGRRRTLRNEMAAELDLIAPYSKDGLGTLRDEAGRYRNDDDDDEG